MNIHQSHTLTRNGYNGLCDPWHRCTTCGETDAGRAESCNPDAGLVELRRTIDAGDSIVVKFAAARIEELESKISEMREAARGQIVVVETARKMRRDAEHVIDFVALVATRANLTADEKIGIIAKHPTILAKTGGGNG